MIKNVKPAHKINMLIRGNLSKCLLNCTIVSFYRDSWSVDYSFSSFISYEDDNQHFTQKTVLQMFALKIAQCFGRSFWMVLLAFFQLSNLFFLLTCISKFIHMKKKHYPCVINIPESSSLLSSIILFSGLLTFCFLIGCHSDDLSNA